jgi:hypothetical protein
MQHRVSVPAARLFLQASAVHVQSNARQNVIASDLQHHNEAMMQSGEHWLARIWQSLATMYVRIVVGLQYWSRIG